MNIAFVALALFQQVFASDASTYVDAQGNQIGFEIVKQRMATGQFTIVPVAGKDDTFRLVDRASAAGTAKDEQRSAYPTVDLAPGSQASIRLGLADHLLLPVTVRGEHGEISGAAIFDTGTFVPFAALAEVNARVGTIQEIDVDGQRFRNIGVGSYGRPERIHELEAQYREILDREFNDGPLLGIIGGPFFGGISTLLDIGDGRLVLGAKPTDDMIAAEYVDTGGNIWIKASDGSREFVTHLDSGYPFSWLDTSMGDVQDFAIGGVDFSDLLGSANWRHLDQKANYESTGLPVKAGLGVDSLKKLEMLIDRKAGKIYLRPNKSED